VSLKFYSWKICKMFFFFIKKTDLYWQLVPGILQKKKILTQVSVSQSKKCECISGSWKLIDNANFLPNSSKVLTTIGWMRVLLPIVPLPIVVGTSWV